ncbi:hypothetical protein HMPREF7215_0524 [Pyramidobacter piscolens W5455]|uniref:Uncharacterized protein n=1 Tax=Pyramidobacter piscolens W5455 TaxID=352165 RepID=A0ABM9ZXU6_9BACT|nr:hypothetical protein HMPREF7215_0524 [Pyramidobacter piscolens W5455]
MLFRKRFKFPYRTFQPCKLRIRTLRSEQFKGNIFEYFP